MSNKKAYVESYGCAHNESDARIIRAILEKEAELVDDPAKADFIFINSCGVKLVTEQRMLSRIRELVKNKGILVVCGCLPKINERAIRKAAPNCYLVDTDSLDKIPELLKNPNDFLSNERINKLCLAQPKQGLTAIIGIGEGCVSKCSYCGTKHARGALHSYPAKDVVSAVGSAVANGAKEIYLTSEDTGCYGLDINYSLPQLINDVAAVEGDFKIRVGMMNPNHAKKMIKDLITAYKNEKVYKFAHIPVQSGSDKVLKEMNRLYKVSDFEQIVSELRKPFPKITISTDIIVGFPTETKKDFEETIDLLNRVKPDITNISKFAVRSRTKASKMKQLPTQEIKRRSVEVSKLARQLSLEANKREVGSDYTAIALASGRKGGVIGRAPNYKQLVFEGELGQKYRVEVVSAHSNYLEAKTIK